MAHLWIRRREAWEVLPLERDRVTLAELCRAAGQDQAVGSPPRGALCRTRRDREEWHLVAEPGPGLAVNGVPLGTGLRTLADRDEIHLTGLPACFFSTERLATVEPLPGLGREVSCPRCRQRIAIGTPAVRCPGCELWHHQSQDLPCWAYAASCAVCPQLTDEDAGFRWTPEAG